MKIVKHSGDIVTFDKNKLKSSLEASGAEAYHVQEVLSEVEKQLYEGMSTKKIYRLAFKLLKRKSKATAARYNLKSAIQSLGPAGFFFEKFIARIFEFEGYKTQTNIFLEGTGSMVLDRANKIAYACLSVRTEVEAFNNFCQLAGYKSVIFNAVDSTNYPIYHTNVMMCIATEFALIGSSLITSVERAKQVIERLAETGKEWIDLTEDQIANFAGNALELNTPNGRVLAISARALGSLQAQQIKTIEKSCQILSLNIPTIEMAGGSVRCMLAGIHLSSR